MKYERIERTLEETIEFFDEIKWSIANPEKDLLLNQNIEAYKKYYSQMPTAQSVIDFFFKQVEEFEEGQLCWFYDDNLEGGRLATFNGYAEDIFYKDIYNDKWLNCISIEEFIKRLKDYL